jgi:hypothetical protein
MIVMDELVLGLVVFVVSQNAYIMYKLGKLEQKVKVIQKFLDCDRRVCVEDTNT